MDTKVKRTIDVKHDTAPVASGELAVVLSVPRTGTFTPADTDNPITLTGLPIWTFDDDGLIEFGFQITGQAIGSFPVGNYRFIGRQRADGNPHGHVVFPGGQPDDSEAEEDDTWQASAGKPEPYASSVGAS